MKIISQHTVIAILVKDQEEALRFYTQKLGLEKRKDITFGPGMRLLTVAPHGQQRPELALAKPDIAFYGEERVKELMTQGNQKVASVFVIDDCYHEYETLRARGVQFVYAPTRQLYGVEALFVDPDGNMFSLLEANPGVRASLERNSFGTAA